MKYLFLSLLISQFTLANNFLGDINSEPSSYTLADLRDEVIEQAKIRKGYLSLGESHLQYDTVLPIILEYAKIYADHKKNFDLCSEDIGHAVKHPLFKYAQKLARKTFISEGNNPVKTDFIECNKRKNQSKIYYSGFFHQFPFARAYPHEFAQVPVITEPGNNIWKQNKKDGLFIMVMELVHLESSASREVLMSSYNSSDINAKIKDLRDQIQTLKAKMIDLNGHSSIYKKKNGYIFSSAQLGRAARNYSPQNAYFILTELDYRMSYDGLHFLYKFSQLDSQLQNIIIGLSPKQKYFVSTLNTANSASDLDSRFGYGLLPQKFEMGTTFLQFKDRGNNLLMVSEPSSSNFRFINVATKKEMSFEQFANLMI